MSNLIKELKSNTKTVLDIAKTTGFFTAVAIFLPNKVMGQVSVKEVGDEAKRGVVDTQQGNDLVAFIVDLMNYAVTLIGLVAVGFLIYGGVMYITAGGDEAKVEKATKAITQALIGLGIVLLSGLIVNFVIARIEDPNPSGG